MSEAFDLERVREAIRALRPLTVPGEWQEMPGAVVLSTDGEAALALLCDWSEAWVRSAEATALRAFK